MSEWTLLDYIGVLSPLIIGIPIIIFITLENKLRLRKSQLFGSVNR